MNLLRARQCLCCAYTWSSLARYTVNSNISGEATSWCPNCGARSVMSETINSPSNPRGIKIVLSKQRSIIVDSLIQSEAENLALSIGWTGYYLTFPSEEDLTHFPIVKPIANL